MGQPQLTDIAKALERTGVDDPGCRLVEANRVPERVSDGPKAAVGHPTQPDAEGSEDMLKVLVVQLIARAYPARAGSANDRIGPPCSLGGLQPLPCTDE